MLWEADVLVAHNAKFDVLWLEMGFTLRNVYCTMIGEYKGCTELSLKATAQRRQVTTRNDSVDELFKSGVGLRLCRGNLTEYAEADVRACGESCAVG